MKNQEYNFTVTCDRMTIENEPSIKEGDVLNGIEIDASEIKADKVYILQNDNLQTRVKKVKENGNCFQFYSVNPKYSDENFTIRKDELKKVFKLVVEVNSYSRFL